MNNHAIGARLLNLATVTLFALFVCAAQAAAPAHHSLMGLGLHQETGRDIYLGALYLPVNTPAPLALETLTGARIAEYRITARRTSMRSLLGGMLLQSEVATGQPADGAVNAFADALLTAVKSSLYAGDALQIIVEPDGQTAVALNGYELTRMPDSSVADYLLQGWLSENGPSSQFRQQLINPDIDQTLSAQLAALNASEERNAQIASWQSVKPIEQTTADSGTNTPTVEAPVEPQEEKINATRATAVIAAPKAQPQKTISQQEPAPAAKTNPESSTIATIAPPPPPKPAAIPTGAVSAGDNVESVTQTSDSTINPDPIADTTSQNTNQNQPKEAPLAGGVAAASIAAEASTIEDQASDTLETPPQLDDATLDTTPTEPINTALVEQATAPTLDDEVAALGLQEYSERLIGFHRDMIAKVYGKIRYPNRAVKRNLQGRVDLDVTMRNTGKLIAVAIANSSGHKLLDEAAVEAAEAALEENKTAIDPVAIAEFGDGDHHVVIPVPVNFQLTN